VTLPLNKKCIYINQSIWYAKINYVLSSNTLCCPKFWSASIGITAGINITSCSTRSKQLCWFLNTLNNDIDASHHRIWVLNDTCYIHTTICRLSMMYTRSESYSIRVIGICNKALVVFFSEKMYYNLNTVIYYSLNIVLMQL